MESNYKEKIIEKYSGGGEVNRAAQTGDYGMEFIYTKKALDGYIDSSKRVIELGCGGGYYLMHYAPKCKEYLGVDLSPVNVAITKEQITAGGYTNVHVIPGDATQLTAIDDESYDVVLCLGPLYHLNREDRKQCIAECKRICMMGVDFLVLEDEIESFTEEQRHIWFQFADMVVGSEYATALSNHALFICEKI